MRFKFFTLLILTATTQILGCSHNTRKEPSEPTQISSRETQDQTPTTYHEPKQHDILEDAKIIIRPDGKVIPISTLNNSKKGHAPIEFKECGKDCGLYRQGVKIIEVETVQITIINYTTDTLSNASLKKSNEANYHIDGVCSHIKTISQGHIRESENQLDGDCSNFIGEKGMTAMGFPPHE